MIDTSLFNGIVVIIDDEINKEEANIKRLIRQISDKKIPYISFEQIPNEEIINHFEGVSFVLLDWKLNSQEIDNYTGEGVRIPDALKEIEISTTIQFIKQIKEKFFIPIFIFTNEEKSSVIDKLREAELYDDNKPNFIFVENKGNLTEDNVLFKEIECWVQSNPSVYVLKKWDISYCKAKNKLFWDFYERSPIWPQILWKCFMNDGVDSSRELGEIILRNLYSRLSPFEFDDTVLQLTEFKEYNSDELRSVLEGERFIKAQYLNPNEKFTGDIFKETIDVDGQEKDIYWLNIRAQCDIVRDSNPKLYCLKGKVVNELDNTKYKFEQGHFIEKNHQVIIPCIDGGKIIDFSFRSPVKKSA
mgnify:FL=1